MLPRLLLLRPDHIQRRLARFVDAGLIDRAPTSWQLTAGVLRMWHRILFRSDTIGTSRAPVRATLRARILAWRALRFPFLLAERAVSPWDLTGLLSGLDRVTSHLLAAHHEGPQFLYDFELLAPDPYALRAVADTARAIADGTHPRAAWFKDLVVFDGYHEALAEAAEAYLADPEAASAPFSDDPDVSFLGYLRWCAARPEGPDALLLSTRSALC